MSDPTPQPAGNPATTEPAQPPPAPSAAQPTTPPAVAFTQEQVDRFLADERRKWKKQQDDAAAKIKADADAAALAEQGKWQELAQTAEAKAKQLEADHQTAQERLTAYETEMERQIKGRLKELPDEIKAMAPEGDTLMRFAWLDKAEAAAAKLTAQPPTPKPPLGTPTGPRGSGSATTTHAPDLAAQKRASGEYAI